jgi:hypothetical protein
VSDEIVENRRLVVWALEYFTICSAEGLSIDQL